MCFIIKSDRIEKTIPFEAVAMATLNNGTKMIELILLSGDKVAFSSVDGSLSYYDNFQEWAKGGVQTTPNYRNLIK